MYEEKFNLFITLQFSTLIDGIKNYAVSHLVVTASYT